MATEIVWFTLAQDINLTTGDAKNIWDETLKTISGQPGQKEIFWGHGVENPSLVKMIVDWESLQAHQEFISLPIYAPFIANLKPLLSSPISMFHISFSPFDPKPLSAPVTEVISQYFDLSYPNEKYKSNFANFAKEGEKHAGEVQGLLGGWAIEEQKHSLGKEDGEEMRAKLFGAFVGWPTVEAHLNFRNTEAFPGVVKWIRDGPKATEISNIQAILATQFKEFGLGETRNGNFAPLLGNGIFASDGKQWEHSRALLRPQFAREQVSDLALEENHVQNMMRCLPANPDGWTAVTDIQTLFFRLTIDSATEFLFGQSVDSQLADLPGFSTHSTGAISEKDFAYAFDRAQWGLGQAGRLGDFYWLRHNDELKKNSEICHDFIDHYVRLALSKPKAPTSAEKSKYVFIDALAESTQNPIELRNQLLNILLAGRDTTASLLSYLFMLFDKYPNVYKKLRSVILEEFGTYENSREITFSKLKSCNYLQWCLNETLRLYPIVPIDGRRALVDTTIPTGGGRDGTSPIYIRKGMPVDYSLYSLHHRKDLWGEDAEDFKPERFDGRRHGWEYLPFNGGPRICIGQQFALTEAGYVIVRLLQKFSEVVGVGNSWEPLERGGVGYVKHNLTLTACPADGVKVRLKVAEGK